MSRFVVTPMPTMLLVELERAYARCRMGCAFCPEKYETERTWDLGDDVLADIVAEARALAADDPRPVYLESADVLELAVFDALVDAWTANGRQLYVATPGLRLAEPGVAARYAGRPVRFDLTLHGATDAVADQSTGRPGAHATIVAAVDALHAAGVPFHLSLVITEANSAELADTVRLAATRWGVRDLSIKVFWPDTAAGGIARIHPDYLEQFPDLRQVQAEVASLADVPGMPRLDLYNLPFCQVEPTLLADDRVRVLDCYNAFRAYALPQCTGCAAREVCPGMHLHYVRHHAVRRPDPAAIARVLAARPGPA
ncbi:MAG: radical SAM protein [Alphaproteobacteria bacterium]|nr:radical SAM protein [Alphaproteobacteria bacterium]